MRIQSDVSFTFGPRGNEFKLSSHAAGWPPATARLTMAPLVSWDLTPAECEEVAAVFSRMAAVLREGER